tara:strand:+ start:983 stop:1585 length:603 start_codon:yes stop_codon:yes gene_type:complete
MPSHKLLTNAIEERFFSSLSGKTLIEIGSTREIVSNQNSSEYFITFCKKHNMKFISIDMDPKCSENALNFCKKHNFDNYLIKTMKGEDFLQDYTEKIDFIYLDAFDFWHPNHGDVRKESYKQNLGVELSADDNLCHQMHYECAYHMINNKCVTKDTIICHDDIVTPDAKRGKGVLSIPYLLENGFKISKYESNGMILQMK